MAFMFVCGLPRDSQWDGVHSTDEEEGAMVKLPSAMLTVGLLTTLETTTLLLPRH